MEPQERMYATAVRPREAQHCKVCNRILFVFEMVGEPDLCIWKDEFPQGVGFTEFVAEKLHERARKKMI